MIAAITAFASWLGSLVVEFASWIITLLLYIPQQTYSLLMTGLGAVISAIPAPDFITQTATAASGITGAALWWMDMLAVPQGLAMFFSAAILRFTLRRIPFIGG